MTREADAPAAWQRTKARKSSRANLVLLLVSLIVSFVILEIGARMVLPAPPPWRYPQVRYRADADFIFALAPDQRSFTGDQPAIINARGLRGEIVPYARTPGVLRVLFLGDSITFGAGVEMKDVVSTRLARRLDALGIKNEVINFGVPAYNTDQEVSSLEHEGLKYAPDVVVVGVCWNDIGDKSAVQVDRDGVLTDAHHDLTPTYSERISESPLGYEIRNAMKRSRALYGILQGWRALRGSMTRDELTQVRADVLAGHDTPRIRSGWDRVAGALRRLRDASKEHGFHVVLVGFPIPLSIEKPFPANSYPKELRRVADELGIPLIDIEPSYRKAFHGHESLFIPYDGDHPNATGHDIVAAEIAAYLQSNGLLTSGQGS